jgi:hypothetical protein
VVAAAWRTRALSDALEYRRTLRKPDLVRYMATKQFDPVKDFP